MHSNILTIGLAAIACIVPTVVGSCNGAKGIITDCCWGGTNKYVTRICSHPEFQAPRVVDI